MNLCIDIIINTDQIDINTDVYDGLPFSTPVYRRFQHPKNALEMWNLSQNKNKASESKISINIPHIIILDLRSYGRIGLRFLATIRQRFPSAKIPILLLMDLRQPLEFRRSVFLQRECYSVTIDEHSTIQSIQDEIREQLQMIQEVRYPHPLHMQEDVSMQEEQTTTHAQWKTRNLIPTQIINLHHLELLCWIWRERKDIRFQFQKYEWFPNTVVPQMGEIREAIFLNGGFTKVEDADFLTDLLHNYGAIHLESIDRKGLGDWITHGEMLFFENKKHVEPGFLRERQQLQLQCPSDFWEDLPILDHTKTILEEGTEQSISQVLLEQNIRAMDIEEDIETLYQMGLLSFYILETHSSDISEVVHDDLEVREEPEFHIADKIDDMLLHKNDPWMLYQISEEDTLIQIQNKLNKTIELWESRYACLTLPYNKSKWHQLIQVLEQNTYYVLVYGEISQHFHDRTEKPYRQNPKHLISVQSQTEQDDKDVEIRQEKLFRQGLIAFCQKGYLSALTSFTMAVHDKLSIRNMVFTLWAQIRILTENQHRDRTWNIELQQIRENIEIFMFEHDHNAIIKYLYIEILLYQGFVEEVKIVMEALQDVMGKSYIAKDLENMIRNN